MNTEILKSEDVLLNISSTISTDNTNDNILSLIKLIINKFDIKNISSLDTELSLNSNESWLPRLVEQITPLYNNLINDKNIKKDNINNLITDLTSLPNKTEILKLIESKEPSIDTINLGLIINLTKSVGKIYKDLLAVSKDTAIKKALTQANIITLLTIISITILFLIYNDKVTQSEINLVIGVIECLDFTLTVTKSNLFSCLKLC
jgi:hypothetical protein